MKRVITVLAVALVMAAMLMAMAMPAFARITCTSPGGGTPSGTACESPSPSVNNENPAGHAPPGQNP